MSIVTLSHDAFCDGADLAGKVAERLGYRCVGPEIIEHACRSLEVSSSHLRRVLQQPSPRFFPRLKPKRERFLAMFRAMFFESMCSGDVVYHGAAGHIFLADVEGVVKVQILGDPAYRVRHEMASHGLTQTEATARVQRDVQRQEQWMKAFTGVDPHDSRCFDITLNLRHLSQDAALGLVVQAVQAGGGVSNAGTLQSLRDMARAAKVEARLFAFFPEVEATAKDGHITVRVNGSILQEEAVVAKAREMLHDMEGMGDLRIGVTPSIYIPF